MDTDIKRSTRIFGCGLVFGLALSACTPQETGTEASDRRGASGVTVAPVTVAEAWLTERDERDNVDSVAVWADAGRQWLLATAKESHVLIVYDAATGEALDRIGGAGNAAGRFLRPNGISVVDDRVWVVERDNHRVQVLSLPDFEPVATFGAERLEKPYGLWVMPTPEGYRVFVTDAYEMPDESVPPDDRLDERLHVFEVTLDGGMRASYGGALGPTEGEGVLKKVESIYGDPAHDRLLVADELAAELDVKLFDLQGRFTGETLGEGILRYEPEGIALARCPGQRGYWIVTDQDEQANRFLVFDRVTLDYLGAFTGETTRNTDGVWLHQSPLPGFDAGAFYAVHNDGNVAAFDLGAIYAELGLEACPPAG